MDECDLEPEEPAPRALVDQLGALGGELVERGADVVDLEGDVVHPGPRLERNLPTGVSSPSAAEQLDPVRADAQRGGLDALLLDRLAVLELGAEKPFVGRERLVEIVDGDPRC